MFEPIPNYEDFDIFKKTVEEEKEAGEEKIKEAEFALYLFFKRVKLYAKQHDIEFQTGLREYCQPAQN